MSTSEITNRDDVIDSRDVIARIEELSDERDGLAEDATEHPPGTEDAARALAVLDAWNAGDDGQELAALMALAEEAEGAGDWQYGATLIRDSYFENYAREFADDIGALNSKIEWPYTCIDWERAARELQQDYMSVDFAGVTYWIRD